MWTLRPLYLLSTLISLLADDVAFVKQSANCFLHAEQFMELILIFF